MSRVAAEGSSFATRAPRTSCWDRARVSRGELRIVPARVKKGPSLRVSGARGALARTAARRLVPRAARRS